MVSLTSTPTTAASKPNSNSKSNLTKTKNASSSLLPASSSPAPPRTPMQSILKKTKPVIKSTPTPLGMTVAGQKRGHAEMDLSSLSSQSEASSVVSAPLSSNGSEGSAGGDVDVDVDGPPAKKRARVKFEPEVEVRRFLRDGDRDRDEKGRKAGNGGEPVKTTAIVREEVRRAIQRHVSGSDSDAYDRVKEVFLADPKKLRDGDNDEDAYELPTHASLKNHLLGLLSNVSALDRRCNGLVEAVLGSEWLGRDEKYVRLFIRFLGNLGAAQGGYLGAVLKMLVDGLGDVSRAVGKLPGYPVVRNSEIYARTHMALCHILRLVPAGSGSLAPVLSAKFPDDSDSVKANVAYTRNLIKMIDYAPELQSDILALIMEKLVGIDVQIQVDMEEFEDEVGEDIVQDVSGPEYAGFEDEDKDNEDDEDDDEPVLDEDLDADSKRVKVVRENIRKLDCMIDIMFEYYNPAFTTGTINDKENALDLLLSHFQSIILPTYRSRHSQFLLFHFSQTSPLLIDRFATTCVEMLFSKRQSGIRRASAAAYLASFVARGAHVSPNVIHDVFDLLGTHLGILRAEYEDTCRGPDLRSYSAFYSTAQALLYIFCFRWRDLTTAAMECADEPPGNQSQGQSQPQPQGYPSDYDLDDITFPPQIKQLLHQTIYSKLNPLKICSPAIVSEFARIAHHLRLLYVFPLLETNKRLRVSNNPSFLRNMAATDTRFSQAERETRAGAVEGGYQLDAYFPFDPYHLPRSRRWLEGDYVEWRGIPGLDGRRGAGNDEDDDTEDSEVEAEEEEDEVMDSDEESD